MTPPNVQATPDGAEYSESPSEQQTDATCRRLEIEPAAGGGFVAQCDSGSGDLEKYALKDRAALDALLDSLFGAAAPPEAPGADVATESAGPMPATAGGA